jgi:hypothetical protein
LLIPPSPRLFEGYFAVGDEAILCEAKFCLAAVGEVFESFLG